MGKSAGENGRRKQELNVNSMIGYLCFVGYVRQMMEMGLEESRINICKSMSSLGLIPNECYICDVM